MKQEKTQKRKKWIWLLVALAALLAVVGVVLALVLGGAQQEGPEGSAGGRPQLYWNVEREQYIEEETGMSTRTKGEDGMYHVLFAHDGQQVELTVADKQIVNVIESMDVMGLAFDADGIVVDAVDPKTIATEFAKRFYISKVTETSITVNSSYAMNGMEKEIPITDTLGIYDVDPNAEVIGAAAEVGVMDEILVYANDLNEPTHLYILKRAPEAGIYWRVERMYDTEKSVTTREPDENGVYTILCAHEGKLVELKCKDKALVTKIDSSAPLIGAFAFVFDDEGYIVGTENVALALRGKLLAQDYHVMEVNGDQITVERISSGSDQGKRITFTMNDDCEIYNCCRTDCFEDHCGEPTDHLRQYDRINVYSDLEGNPILIYVTIRQIDSPMYYNLKRMYSSANGGGTTREKEGGYYVFDMLEEGKQVTLRTKDKAIADSIDYPYHGCMGLDVEGDIITRVYDAQCVAGYYSPGYRRVVTSLTGGIFTITNATDSSIFANCIMAEGCKIYDVTGNPGVKKGTTTTLQLGDRVVCWYDYAQKIGYIYVTDREVTVRDYCQYCKKTVTWEVAPVNGLGTIDTGKHLHYVLGQDTDVAWGYGVLNKGTTLCLNLYGSTIEHTSRIFVAGGSKLNIMGSGGIISNATHKNESLKTGNITVNNGEVNIYGGTIRSLSSKMPSININGKDAVVNLYGGSVIGGVDINIGTLNLGGKTKVLGAKGQLENNIYVGTTGKLNVKADWTGEASVKVAIVSATGISKTFGTSEGAYTGKLYYESKGNPAVIGQDGGLVVVGEIIPDENDPDYRYCEHCGKRVMWSPAPVSGHGTLNSGEHIHYYLTEDFIRDWGYVVLQDKTTVCLDLNGFTINQMGRIFVGGAELNIMGEGTVTTRVHKNATLNTGAITVNTGTVNIYGGTYTSDNANAPAILVNGNAATVNLLGGKVLSGLRANAGSVILGGNAAVNGTKGKNIYISNDAELTVLGDWTGTAGVAFSYVAANPVENGSCTGAYTGKLTLEEDNGYQIVPQDGKLYIPGYTIKAEVPIEPNFPVDVANGVTSEAWCEACQKNVIWTSASSGLSSRADGGRHHVFVSLSRPVSDPLTWQLGTVNNGTTVCLYLNNTETTHNGRLFVLAGSTVNIMGKGSLITNGTSTGVGALTGGITVNEGTVNVLGDITIKSTNSAVPAVSVKLANAAVNMASGTIVGGAAVDNGKLELSGTVTADSIALKETGKLNVLADWTGTADVTFKNLEENPVPNGTATGAFTGKLTTTIADTKYDVVEQNGKLYISGYEGGAIPETPIAPNFPVGVANGMESEAWCEACQKNVIWISASSGLSSRTDGGHYHLFVSISRPVSNPLTWQLGTVNSGTTVCLYLNDTVTTHNGRLFVVGGSTVNIMGKGSLITNGTSTSAGVLTGGITVNEGTVNVLGDIALKSTNSAVPAVAVQYANATVNLGSGITVEGGVQVNNGKLTLAGSATADTITVADAGKLEVAESFTGTAKVTFASITENPVANGLSTGAYTGKLTTTIDGKDYDIVAQDGKLLISGYTVPGVGGDEEDPTDPTEPSDPTDPSEPTDPSDPTGPEDPEEPADDGLLHLDADGYAECEHCGQSVQWTELTATIGELTTGTHHYYLSKDWDSGYTMFSVNTSAQLCLHLNGKTLEFGRRIRAYNATTLNIMGDGTIIGTNANPGSNNQTTIEVGWKATVNIYGGNYASTAEGVPTFLVNSSSATLNLKGGKVTDGIQLDKGVVTLSGDTKVDSIAVAETGKLSVKADWTGSANATFANKLTDGIVPVENGTSEGNFTGELTTADGKKLIAKDGGLVLQAEGLDEILNGRQIAAAANAMAFPTELKNGLTHEAYCPVCKADKTWTSYNTGFSTYFSDGGHHHIWIPTTNTITWGMGTISNGTTVCVHLNGAEMTHNSRLVIKGGSVVNFMGTGALISNGTNSNAANVTGTITVTDATVNLFGGTYISTASNGAPAIHLQNAAAKVNIYSGATVGGENDGVCTNVKITNGELNMYGGTIRNGVTAAHGGNVLVGSGTSTTTSAVFNMYEGTITGGKAYTQTYAKGGNVFVFGTSGKIDTAVFNMTGGTIEKGAAVYGGNVAVQYATASISGTLSDGVGTPSEGYKNPWGGNIYICNDSVVTFDGTITGGTGVYSGSVCVAAKSTLTMNGGSITGGVGAKNGGNVRVDGTFIMNDGIISGGNVTDETNGSHNLYVNNGTAILNGGTIYATDGTSLSGTGLYLNGTATVYLGGNTSIVRKDGAKQGCIVVGGSAKLCVLNDWTGNASVKLPATYAYGASVAEANGQCGSLADGIFTAGGSYAGILTCEDPSCIIKGSEGALVLENPQDGINDGVLKILGIGNSFTMDSMHLLYDVYKAENPDQEIVLAYLYKGGCSLETHVKNLTDDTAAYTYYKMDSTTNGKWSATKETTMETGILADNWDIVTMQQNSGNSFTASTYNDDIVTIQNYVVNTLGYKPEFVWNFTWGYPDDEELLNTSSDTSFAQNFASKHGTTEAMYNKISAVVQEKIVNGSYSFDYLMPVGTAIQNARSNHLTAKELYRDYAHLNNLGRLVAAYTWYCEFEGYNGTDKVLTDLKLTKIPASLALTTAVSNGVTELDAELEAIVIESVNNALKNKFAVTKVTE